MTIPTPVRRCSLCDEHASLAGPVLPSVHRMTAGMPSKFVQWACRSCRDKSDWDPVDLPFTERHDRFALKIITLREPWLWLISAGYKCFENRTRRWKQSGRILLHASTKVPDDAYWATAEQVALSFGVLLPSRDFFDNRYGRILAVASFSKMIQSNTSGWFFGPYAWPIQWAWPVTSPRLRGQLGLWTSEKTIPVTITQS